MTGLAWVSKTCSRSFVWWFLLNFHDSRSVFHWRRYTNALSKTTGPASCFTTLLDCGTVPLGVGCFGAFCTLGFLGGRVSFAGATVSSFAKETDFCFFKVAAGDRCAAEVESCMSLRAFFGEWSKAAEGVPVRDRGCLWLGHSCRRGGGRAVLLICSFELETQSFPSRDTLRWRALGGEKRRHDGQDDCRSKSDKM